MICLAMVTMAVLVLLLLLGSKLMMVGRSVRKLKLIGIV